MRRSQKGGSFLNDSRRIPNQAYMTEMLEEDSIAPVLIQKEEA